MRRSLTGRGVSIDSLSCSKRHLPRGICLLNPFTHILPRSSAETTRPPHPKPSLVAWPLTDSLTSAASFNLTYKSIREEMDFKFKPNFNFRIKHNPCMIFFPPAEYYPNRILGGAQRRFGSDDECQIVESWHLYWAGGECHLEEESSCAEKAGRMRATPKACTSTFMDLFVYFYKCKQEVGIFTINWLCCKLSLDGNPAEYFCKACKFHFTKLERSSDTRSNSAIRC